MYAKIFALAALATAVVAAPGGASDIEASTSNDSAGVANSCNVSDQQCCNQVHEVNPRTLQIVEIVAAMLGKSSAIGPITGLVGVDCSSITVHGISGNSCSTQPVCCSNNEFEGLIAIGCSPINVNL